MCFVCFYVCLFVLQIGYILLKAFEFCYTFQAATGFHYFHYETEINQV